jgi:hypothetical protein
VAIQAKERSGRTFWLVAGIVALCLALVGSAVRWPGLVTESGMSSAFPFQETQEKAPTVHPLLELLKLVSSALIGLAVTAVHGRSRRKKPLSRSLAQAQILLCVAGTLVMIIIGNSIGRAFGAFGIASIIRFRTPLENPKDAAVLLVLLGLGMSCGVGAFAMAGLGTLFVCLFLMVLDYIGPEKREALKPRFMALEIVSDGREFPTAHVQSVFSRHQIEYESREISQGKEPTVKYHVRLDRKTSLDELNAQLLNGGASGIKSLAWEKAKKRG